MAKNRDRHGMSEAQTSGTESEAQSSVAESAGAEVASASGVNNTVTFRRNHPKNRASYGIAGVSGIIVVDRAMFASATAPASDTDLAGLPQVLTLDAAMAALKADASAERERIKAEKVIEKAAKAQLKIEAAAAKAVEKQAKADAALKAAQDKDKVAAAAAKVTTAASPADL